MRWILGGKLKVDLNEDLILQKAGHLEYFPGAKESVELDVGGWLELPSAFCRIAILITLILSDSLVLILCIGFISCLVGELLIVRFYSRVVNNILSFLLGSWMIFLTGLITIYLVKSFNSQFTFPLKYVAAFIASEFVFPHVSMFIAAIVNTALTRRNGLAPISQTVNFLFRAG